MVMDGTSKMQCGGACAGLAPSPFQCLRLASCTSCFLAPCLLLCLLCMHARACCMQYYSAHATFTPDNTAPSPPAAAVTKERIVSLAEVQVVEGDAMDMS